jgi:hypothetical protein
VKLSDWEDYLRDAEQAHAAERLFRARLIPLASRGPDGVWIITDCEPYAGGGWVARAVRQAGL